jgi:hypothetical protein
LLFLIVWAAHFGSRPERRLAIIDTSASTAVLVQATPGYAQASQFADLPPTHAQPLSPLRVDTRAQLPQPTYDLLFHDGHTLQVWRTATGQIEPLVPWEFQGEQSTAQPIDNFVVDSNDRSVILLQRREGMDSSQRYTLRRYDIRTQRLETLLDEIPYLYDLSISPDDKWLTYQLKQEVSLHHYSWLAGLFHSGPCGCGEGPLIGARYVQRLRPLAPAVKLNTCAASDCSSVLGWLDGEIVWQEQTKFWRGGVVGMYAAARYALPGAPAINRAPVANKSPQERFVLIWVHLHPDIGYAVLDLLTGRAAIIPNTLQRVINTTSATWLQDGRLLLARPAGQTGAPQPGLELWSVHPDEPHFLRLDKTLSIPVHAQNHPREVAQLNDGRIAFALLSTDPHHEAVRGLYLLDIDLGELYKVNHLPPATLDESAPEAGPCCLQITWLPDGSGAIFADPKGRRLGYIPADGSLPYDLGPLLGDKSWGFTPLPPRR